MDVIRRIPRDSVVSRVHQWLRATPPSGPAEEVTQTEFKATTSKRTDAAAVSHIPCRACRESGIDCDCQKPRCSHCLHEQLLCFYIPTTGAKRRTVRR
ncbi:hypothetical protein ASPZODRAFT_1208134 [Penicilliopsis zonata CBS 506.65]|uniref:Zn(2)-C6 fungal-type domain-containing protein n=1 Tax=Penicilliopsis zonata CBS 506.65 TaxID=1073090 RepID=A0A1L9S7C3_9EURO|nr:hypothetical protein ASPZODRAFT_1208134 [Penicilliopsis zonata CBS 506.65]OJJ43048.1 hypothetical protein ASPZODRAFT_1208134 [Penicilliopsis zonata CBS 506.65]